MDRTKNCAECGFMEKYDYGKEIYYCGNENRIDDMGKLGVGKLPDRSPGWCPLKEQDDNALLQLIYEIKYVDLLIVRFIT